MTAWASAAVGALSDQELGVIARHFERNTGICLSAEKRAMVAGRLQSRLRLRGVASFAEYVQLLDAPEESRALIEALTTHETSFFREPRHFEVLAREARARAGAPTFRVWSAACSSGEEACSVALTLAEVRAGPWEVVGTDVADETVAQARAGLYPLERGAGLPLELKRRHALRGIGPHEGQFCLRDGLRARLRFEVANLLEPQPQLGHFDVALVRNVLIYFDPARQQQILGNVLAQVRPGGLLLVGHTETVGSAAGLTSLEPSVYRVPARSAR